MLVLTRDFVRHVKTPAGAKYYHLPIGSPIVGHHGHGKIAKYAIDNIITKANPDDSWVGIYDKNANGGLGSYLGSFKPISGGGWEGTSTIGGATIGHHSTMAGVIASIVGAANGKPETAKPKYTVDDVIERSKPDADGIHLFDKSTKEYLGSIKQTMTGSWQSIPANHAPIVYMPGKKSAIEQIIKGMNNPNPVADLEKLSPEVYKPKPKVKLPSPNDILAKDLKPGDKAFLGGVAVDISGVDEIPSAPDMYNVHYMKNGDKYSLVVNKNNVVSVISKAGPHLNPGTFDVDKKQLYFNKVPVFSPRPNGYDGTAVEEYTGSGALDLNESLRSIEDEDNPQNILEYEEALLSDHLDSSMSQTLQPITVWRAVPPEAFGLNKYAESFDSMKAKEGQIVSDEAYMSTSYVPYIGSNKGIVMQIHVPKGTPALFAQPDSEYPNEHEVLLGRGNSFRILKVTQGEGDLIQVEGNLIPPGMKESAAPEANPNQTTLFARENGDG